MLISHLTRMLVVTVFLFAFGTTQASSHQEWLIFPQIDLIYRNDAVHPTSPKKREAAASVDFFYSSDHNEIKWLAELFASENETGFERLMIGWSPRDNTTIWLGRFHNPLGFWNSLSHHGDYMQTAISRPHIIEYEHDGGSLPNHLSGVQAQITHSTDNGFWSYDIALGYGPELNTQLKALDLLSPGSTENDLGATFRISYKQGAYASNKIGLFASKQTTPIRNSIYQEVDQSILGITSIWSWQTTEMIGAIYYFDNQLTGANNNPQNSFTSAYIQFDHTWRPAWAVYLRQESGTLKSEDPYSQWFPDILRNRTAIGLRHELTIHQALKFEVRTNAHYDDNFAQRNDDFTEFQFQWSAFFP